MAKASEMLEDEGFIHFTNEDLWDSCQDGYDLIALQTQCIELSGAVDIVAGQTYYNLSTLLSGYYRVYAIYNQNTKKWLVPHAYRELVGHGLNWEFQHGATFEWSPCGWDQIAVYRKSEVAITAGFLVFYKAQADVLTGSSVPNFPPELHIGLVEYIVGDLLDQDLEFQKSMLHYEKFTEYLRQIKKVVDSRSTPDRILGLLALGGQGLA